MIFLKKTFFTLQTCKFGGFILLSVQCAVTTQACSSAGAVRVDGLIQMGDICKKYAQVKNSQRSCSGQVFNFSFLRRINLFC